jgi:hypothetical protein
VELKRPGIKGRMAGKQPANDRKHGIAAVALLSTIQTGGMIFRLRRRRLFAIGRRTVLLNVTQLLKI